MANDTGTFTITDSAGKVVDIANDPQCRKASFYNTGASDVLIRADGVHSTSTWILLFPASAK